MYFEFLKRFNLGETLPMLDPIEDMDIEGEELQKYVEA